MTGRRTAPLLFYPGWAEWSLQVEQFTLPSFRQTQNTDVGLASNEGRMVFTIEPEARLWMNLCKSITTAGKTTPRTCSGACGQIMSYMEKEMRRKTEQIHSMDSTPAPPNSGSVKQTENWKKGNWKSEVCF